MFPCNCRPPFPRPEPFSPLPRPGHVPDWGKWIRDRLAEKGALLAFPTRTAFPSAGDAPSLYLAEDTGVVYRWGGEGYAVLVDLSPDVETYPRRSAFPDTGRVGAIYIDASTNLLYRWDGTGYVLLTSDLSGVESRLADVESKVPAQATAQNQLADKAFVNSSVATNTANYIYKTVGGRHVPFDSLAELQGYAGALTNNDYAFVVGADAAGNTTYTRYKWNASTEEWAEEYVLNNSSFTAEQWAAISSGITSGLVAKLGALPTAEALTAALAGKQDKLTFETSVVRGSDNPVKSSGIWAAIWGALSALPAGFTSLYGWCRSELHGKVNTSGDTMTGSLTVPRMFVRRAGAVTEYIDVGRGATGDGNVYPWTRLSPGGVRSHTDADRSAFFSGRGIKVWPYWIDDAPDDVVLSYPKVVGDDTLAALGMIFRAWAANTPYGSGDFVVHDDAVYKCNAAHTSGQEWDAAKWDVANGSDVHARIAAMASKSDVDPLLFAQYYPGGNVKSAAEFTQGIKYDDPDTVNRTITVKPFCDTGTAANDNSSLVGRVVIPPFVDARGDGYITDDGTRYKVVGVSGGFARSDNFNLTAIFAPNTVTNIGGSAFFACDSLASVLLPATTGIGNQAFRYCSSLTSVSLPAATTIGSDAFFACASLTSVSLPSATSIGNEAFVSCESLASVDFGDTPRSSVPSLGIDAFNSVPTSCKIIVPYTQYDAWIAADAWKDLPQEFVRHAEKADKPATFTAGNLAALDANGNPTGSTIPAADVALKSAIPYDLGTPIVIDTASSDPEGEMIYFGAAALGNRTSNIVQVTAPLDELRITFPAATSGKVRDFGLRVEIGTGSAALAAPALVPIAPTGETIKLENADGAIPALADGTATAKGVTLLYFSETAPGVFVVKGEQVEEVA